MLNLCLNIIIAVVGIQHKRVNVTFRFENQEWYLLKYFSIVTMITTNAN